METMTEEGSLMLDDGLRLYTKTWKPSSPPSATLIFVHGFSDHCNTYYTLFPVLASRGIRVFAFDQRGWGRSVRSAYDRGLTGPTSTVLADITSVIRSQKSTTIPLFLMGHSMGGAEVLCWATSGPLDVRKAVRGYIVESPFIRFHPDSQPSRFTVIMGRLAAKVIPKMHLVNKLEVRWLSRDEQVRKDYEKDPLCHDTGTLEGLAGMLDRAAELDDNKKLAFEDEGKGIWVGHGSADHVVSFEASQRLFERMKIKDKEFKNYEGHYHKLHAEPGEQKIRFANDVADWILARIGENTVKIDELRSPRSKL